MKLITVFAITCFALFSLNCSRKENNTGVQSPASTVAPAPMPATPVNPAAPATPGVATAGGVQHYICPNNCQGSGSSQTGNCPVCGTAYLHNAAFHAQDAPAMTMPSQQNPIQQAPQAADPAQNAAGVWHYTCSKGCAGGSGSPGNCSKCGGALAHNQVYHQ